MVALPPKTIMFGNPPIAGHEPLRSDIATWMQEFESIAAGGGLAYIDGALVDLQARAGAVDGQFGLVLNTADEAGVYERIVGEWEKNAAIPTLFLESAFVDLAVDSAAAAALSEAAAATASGAAENHKAQAELAAMAAGAKIVASEGAGLAATSEAEVFIVQSGSATLVYQNLSAAAVLLGTMFDRGDLLQAANNLSDLPDPAAALANLGGLGATGLASLTERLDNDAGVVVTGGSANVQTLAAQNTITAYAALQSFTVRVGITNAGAMTLNVDGLGALAVEKYDNTGALVALAAGDWKMGQIHRVIHDGTRFVVVSPINEIATQAEAEAGTKTDKGMTPERTAQAIAAAIPTVGDAAELAAGVVDESVWHPYLASSGNIDPVVWDFGVDGASNSIVIALPDNTKGNQYRALLRGVSNNTGTDSTTQQLRLAFLSGSGVWTGDETVYYPLTAATAYDSDIVFNMDRGNTVHVEHHTSRVDQLLASNGSNVQRQGNVNVASDDIQSFEISLTSRNFDAGVILLQRRRIY
jgi:hypothetical protein